LVRLDLLSAISTFGIELFELAKIIHAIEVVAWIVCKPVLHLVNATELVLRNSCWKRQQHLAVVLAAWQFPFCEVLRSY